MTTEESSPGLVWFVKNSLSLDYNFLFKTKFSLTKKLEFITKKYFIIIKHVFKPYTLGKSHIMLHGKDFYYDGKYGLASYQRILTTHYKLINYIETPLKSVLDIGGSTGVFSKMIREVYPSAHLYTFEPATLVFNCLEKNFKDDSNTQVFNRAVSDKNTKLRLDFVVDKVGLSQIGQQGILVEAITIDSFIKKNNIKSIDLLKIDVEGHEDSVFVGARESLKITKYILTEITIDHNQNYTLSSLMSLLYSKDFNFQFVAFRSYLDKGNGKIPVMDVLLKNISIS